MPTSRVSPVPLLDQEADFDPAQRAVYYVRVMEIPTPRWFASDAKVHRLKLPVSARLSSQERAWTSPIW